MWSWLSHFFFKIVCKTDNVCNSLVPTGQNGTCYRDGVTVFENYQMCNVTSKVFISSISKKVKEKLKRISYRPKNP